MLSRSDEQMQTEAKIGDIVYDCGEKLGSNHLYLELGPGRGSGY